MFPGQPIHHQRLFDMILDPFHEPAKPFLIAPTGYPGTQCLTRASPTCSQPHNRFSNPSDNAGSALRDSLSLALRKKMDAAPLPQRGRQHFRDRMLQPLMTVRDHILDSPQAASFRRDRKAVHDPSLSRFATSAASTLAPTLAVNPEGNLHRPGAHRALLTHFLIPGIRHHVRIRLLQPAFRKRLQGHVQLFDTMVEIVAGENS